MRTCSQVLHSLYEPYQQQQKRLVHCCRHSTPAALVFAYKSVNVNSELAFCESCIYTFTQKQQSSVSHTRWLPALLIRIV